MSRLVLVRHGRAAAGWDADLDPGLDEVGRSQAEDVAGALAEWDPLPMFTSPLRRARETAGPLEQRWRVPAEIRPAFSEIPSPTDDLAARGAWLRTVMAGTWSSCGPELQSWRSSVLAAMREIPSDAVVFTHFIAITVAVGAARHDDRVVVFAPDNGSRTVVEVAGDSVALVELGTVAQTSVG